MPFLRKVVEGRNVPDDRLLVVAEQYDRFGGVSPINAQNRALVRALDTELRQADIDLPIYWGNRNWHPLVDDVVQTMSDDGVQSALVFVTSAFGSYSGCLQYRQDLDSATAATVGKAPRFEKLRLFYNHPGFIEPMAANLQRTLAEHRTSHPQSEPRVVFTAHSIPVAMAECSHYEQQLREAASLVARAGADGLAWDLVFQSRSGPPHRPWLEPDICDHLSRLSSENVSDVVVVPLGFISDHMEVIFDLDTQAAKVAHSLGTHLSRVPTVGTDPTFVTMIRQLVEERTAAGQRLFLGQSGPWPDQCPTVPDF